MISEFLKAMECLIKEEFPITEFEYTFNNMIIIGLYHSYVFAIDDDTISYAGELKDWSNHDILEFDITNPSFNPMDLIKWMRARIK